MVMEGLYCFMKLVSSTQSTSFPSLPFPHLFPSSYLSIANLRMKDRRTVNGSWNEYSVVCLGIKRLVSVPKSIHGNL